MCRYCFEEYRKGNLICEYCGEFLDLQLNLFKKKDSNYKPLFGEKKKNKKKQEKRIWVRKNTKERVVIFIR